MQTFQESDLTFTFPDDWLVRKFDETAAYKSLSGHGMKGVDFIAISPEGRLWLIEVKNYRARRKGDKEYRAKRRDPQLMAQHVATKFNDSVRLIKVVHSFLQRSWYKRGIIWYQRSVRRGRGSNYWFWSRAHQLCVPTECGTTLEPVYGSALEYVLWMETPEKNKDYDARVTQELRPLMPQGASLTVAESDTPAGLPITTTAISLAIKS